MIRQGTHDKASHKVTRLQASRTPSVLLPLANFERLAKDNPDFTCVKAVETPTCHWQGERGRITEDLILTDPEPRA